MTKILHIATETAWRGGENQLFLLINSSQNLTHYIVAQPGAALIEKLSPISKVVQIRMHNDLDFFAGFGIAKLVKKFEIDVIHAQSARGHALALIAKKLLKLTGYEKRVKLIVHRRVETKQKLSFLEKKKYLSRDVDQYICVSRAIANQLEAAGINKSIIKVVHSAVDSSNVPDRAQSRIKIRDELKIATSATVYCFVGALEEKKGIRYLLDAWQVLVENRQIPSEDRLLIVGTGELQDELILKFGQEKSATITQITILGFRNDVGQILAASDILVHPTLWEGLGTVLLDGILAECLLIATNVGGIPEIIRDGITGLLVPSKDASSLSQSMLKLRNNESLKLSMLKASKELLRSEFSLESMVKGVLDTYTS